MNTDQHRHLKNLVRQGGELLVACDRKRALTSGQRRRIDELKRMSGFIRTRGEVRFVAILQHPARLFELAINLLASALLRRQGHPAPPDI